ncbi:MAG: hypothetical protein K6F62_04760 [Schwartzia sp.]|nr:hypothetical protein [Schwartzia sp. (in: firmicutes)]
MTEKLEYICPCCGKKGKEEEGASDVCVYCGWEEDIVQEADPDYRGGANKMSLNEAKKAFKEGRAVY